jgi:hypothetical protein
MLIGVLVVYSGLSSQPACNLEGTVSVRGFCEWCWVEEKAVGVGVR